MGKERFGVDKEAYERLQNKYDPEQEREVLGWISNVVSKSILSFDQIRNGVILCQMLNQIEPGTVLPNQFAEKPKHRLEEQANITSYLNGCRSIGVPDEYLFQTKDLLDDESRYSVIVNLYAVGREAQVIPSFTGKKLGVTNSVTHEEKDRRYKVKQKEKEKLLRKAEKERKDGERRKQGSLLSSRKAVDDDTREAQRRANFRHKDRESQRNALNISFSQELGSVLARGDDQVLRYGIDREAYEKIRKKQDFELEGQVCDWLEMVNLVAVDDFYTSCRSGVLLCRTVNKIRPGMIQTINEKNIALLQHENIQKFLQACRSFGMLEFELFSENDLFYAMNLPQVVTSVHSFARRVCSIAGYRGPLIQNHQLGVPKNSQISPNEMTALLEGSDFSSSPIIVPDEGCCDICVIL